MTGPKPVNRRPVQLPDITVSSHGPSAIELAFRQMGMTPDEARRSQQDFQARREMFAHDFPRALPAGVPAAIGSGLTDLASLDLPFLPPAFPAVRAKGDELTQHLTRYLQRLFGAPEGSQGTETGTEVGGVLANALVPEAVGSTLERLAPFLRSAPEVDPGLLRPGEARWWTPGRDYQTPVRFTNHDLAGNAYYTNGHVSPEPWNAPLAPQYVPERVVSDVPAYLRRPVTARPELVNPPRPGMVVFPQYGSPAAGPSVH